MSQLCCKNSNHNCNYSVNNLIFQRWLLSVSVLPIDICFFYIFHYLIRDLMSFFQLQLMHVLTHEILCAPVSTQMLAWICITRIFSEISSVLSLRPSVLGCWIHKSYSWKLSSIDFLFDVLQLNFTLRCQIQLPLFISWFVAVFSSTSVSSRLPCYMQSDFNVYHMLPRAILLCHVCSVLLSPT